MNTKEILNRICQKEGFGSVGDYGTNKRLAEFIGVSEANITNWVARNSFTSTLRDAINNKCQDYDKDWLFGNKQTTPEQTQTQTKTADQSVEVKGFITAKELFEMGKIAGRLEKLEEEHDKLEMRHNKLLEGVSRAVSDYASMYGPIVGEKQEGKGASDPQTHPRRDNDADFPSRTG